MSHSDKGTKAHPQNSPRENRSPTARELAQIKTGRDQLWENLLVASRYSLAGPPAAPPDPTPIGHRTLENQARLLNNAKLSVVQRQAFAAQIGQLQGNRHLVRVLAANDYSAGRPVPTPTPKAVIQRQAATTEQTSAQANQVARVLAGSPQLSLEQACRVVADRQAAEPGEEEGFFEEVGEAITSAVSAVGGFFADLWSNVSENPASVVLGVALLNPMAVGPVLAGLSWSVALPILVDHIQEGWVEYVLPHLTFEEISDLFDALEDSQLFGLVTTLATTGILAPFILAIGWDPRILNRIYLSIPRLILRELAEMDRVGFVNWVGAKIDAIWPVGVGYIITGQIGATFGYPIYLGLEGKEDIFRLQAETYELTKVGRITVAADTEAGAGGELSLGPIQAKIEGTAEAQAGYKFSAKEVFEFPTATDDALLPFLLEVAGSEIGTITHVVQPLVDFIPDLSAEQYRQEFTVEAAMFGAAAASAEASIRFGGSAADPEGTAQAAANQVGEQQEIWWQSLLPRAFARAGVNLEAGMGLSLFPQPKQHKLGFKLYARAAGRLSAGAGARILRLIRQQFNLVNVDVEGSVAIFGELTEGSEEIKLTRFEIEGQSSPPEELGAVGGEGTRLTAAYDLNLPEGAKPQTVGEWLYELIPDRLTVEKRLPIGGGFGRGFLLQNKNYLNTILPQRDYREYGAIVQGLLTFEFQLNKAHLEALVAWIGDLITDEGDARAQATRVWNDLQNLFRTGRLPSWMTDEEQIRAFVRTVGLQKAEFRFSVGLALAAGAHAGEGAKVRLHGGMTGVRYHEYDLINTIGSQELIDYVAAHLRAFLGETGGSDQLNVSSMLEGPGVNEPVAQ
jgi:hypothetical protein